MEVRAYAMKKNDLVEVTLDDFLKPTNLNMVIANRMFEVVGYSKINTYWFIKLFGRNIKIKKPFKIKTVKLRYNVENSLLNYVGKDTSFGDKFYFQCK